MFVGKGKMFGFDRDNFSRGKSAAISRKCLFLPALPVGINTSAYAGFEAAAAETFVIVVFRRIVPVSLSL